MLVVALPNETLQQQRMVRHAIEYFGRRQAVAAELSGKVAINHAISSSYR